MPKAKNNESKSESKPSEEKPEETKKIKKDLRLKMLEVLKEASFDERFTIALRDKLPKDYIQDYPDRTIFGCDGEVYNMLMNWAYKHKIANHLAFDRFVEAHGKGLEKIKQRPKIADRASARYWKTNAKRDVLNKEKQKKK